METPTYNEVQINDGSDILLQNREREGEYSHKMQATVTLIVADIIFPCKLHIGVLMNSCLIDQIGNRNFFGTERNNIVHQMVKVSRISQTGNHNRLTCRIPVPVSERAQWASQISLCPHQKLMRSVMLWVAHP
mgnify:CR=1 FL=1